MRAGLLILLSVAVAIAPSAPVLACGTSAAQESLMQPAQQSCCCSPGALACSCASCTDSSSDGSNARQSCRCVQKTPQHNETSQTESVGAEVRIAIGVAATRDEGQQRRGLAPRPVIVRHDPHPEVRQPLLL